ncbi:MAG: class II aldolase/adducin family protein [Candidatus Hodarchaeales archaeon]|jgi:L-fuculose-phosphate aldolase
MVSKLIDQEFKRELCNLMKELYTEGILTDIGGNLSFHSDEDNQYFWITPSGMKKNIVEPEHLIKMSMKGEVVTQDSERNPSIEWPMHKRIFEEDEDFKAIIHSHAPLATALSVVENPPEIPPLTAELGFLVPEIVIVPYKPSGSTELGEAVADTLWDCSIVILENHGVIAVGESFQEAAIKTRALEEYLQLYLNAKKFGKELRKFPGFD